MSTIQTVTTAAAARANKAASLCVAATLATASRQSRDRLNALVKETTRITGHTRSALNVDNCEMSKSARVELLSFRAVHTYRADLVGPADVQYIASDHEVRSSDDWERDYVSVDVLVGVCCGREVTLTIRDAFDHMMALESVKECRELGQIPIGLHTHDVVSSDVVVPAPAPKSRRFAWLLGR
jgi:hypothetical protein